MTQPVPVDNDATPAREPVTVVVSPAGTRYEADSWSDANNYLNMGYAVANGYPTGPAAPPETTAASAPQTPEQTAPAFGQAQQTAPVDEQPADPQQADHTA